MQWVELTAGPPPPSVHDNTTYTVLWSAGGMAGVAAQPAASTTIVESETASRRPQLQYPPPNLGRGARGWPRVIEWSVPGPPRSACKHSFALSGPFDRLRSSPPVQVLGVPRSEHAVAPAPVSRGPARHVAILVVCDRVIRTAIRGRLLHHPYIAAGLSLEPTGPAGVPRIKIFLVRSQPTDLIWFRPQHQTVCIVVSNYQHVVPSVDIVNSNAAGATVQVTRHPTACRQQSLCQ